MKPTEMARAARLAVNECMKVRSDEEVCIVTDTNMLSIAEALVYMSKSIGAETVMVMMSPRKMHGHEPPRVVEQAMLAAEAGVDFVIPFYNRMQEAGSDPYKTIELIKHACKPHGKPKILVASLKTTDQVVNLLPLDLFAITVPPVLARSLIESPLTEKVIKSFD